jgi:hypothetical protein
LDDLDTMVGHAFAWERQLITNRSRRTAVRNLMVVSRRVDGLGLPTVSRKGESPWFGRGSALPHRLALGVLALAKPLKIVSYLACVLLYGEGRKN